VFFVCVQVEVHHEKLVNTRRINHPLFLYDHP
jgi:hypothetical protein